MKKIKSIRGKLDKKDVELPKGSTWIWIGNGNYRDPKNWKKVNGVRPVRVIGKKDLKKTK